MRAWRFLVLALVIGVIAAACQSSETGNTTTITSPPPTTQPPDSTTSTTTAPTSTTTTTIAVAPIKITRDGEVGLFQVWNTNTNVLVRPEPGSTDPAVHRLTPTARDIMTTGSRAEVDGVMWLEIELPGDEVGWIPAANLVPQINELTSVRPGKFVVTGLSAGEKLNVRTNPGVSHDVLTTLALDTTVQTTGLRAEVRDAIWFEVEYASGKTGWVNSRFLTPEVITLPDDQPAVYQVTSLEGSERLNVRKGPGTHEAVVTTLAADAKDIKSTGNRAEVSGSLWREIELADGKVGWVNATFLKLQPPTPTEPPPAQPCKPGGDTFCPQLEVSRGMAAAFLSRALGLTSDGGKDWFTDDNGTPFEAEINRLAAAGILQGCDTGKVCPNDPASRRLVAVLFSRALGLTDDGGKDWFTDDNGMAFEAEINRVAAAGIARACNPPDNTKFCPDKPIVRAQIAAWLVRAFDIPPTSQDFWTDDNGSAFEADINAITAAGIAKK